jgi:hypothetical protein
VPIAPSPTRRRARAASWSFHGGADVGGRAGALEFVAPAELRHVVVALGETERHGFLVDALDETERELDL